MQFSKNIYCSILHPSIPSKLLTLISFNSSFCNAFNSDSADKLFTLYLLPSNSNSFIVATFPVVIPFSPTIIPCFANASVIAFFISASLFNFCTGIFGSIFLSSIVPNTVSVPFEQ